MNISNIIFYVAQCMPGFLMAIVIHEAAHAWMANRFGDSTAKRMGRLTLNPIAHADPIGTVVLPIVGIVSAVSGLMFPVIGWAKPVPVESRNFTNYKKGVFWVSFAGPLSNIILGTICAFFFALLAKGEGDFFGYKQIFLGMLNYSIFINFILAVFNLIPLPPLDGSNMVSVFLSPRALIKYHELGNYTSYILWGLLILSFMGVPILSTLLYPAHYMSNFLTNLFLLILP
jgi:Zn-dependent protease